MNSTRFINKENLALIKAGTFKDFLYERDSALLESTDEDKEVKARIKIQRAILWININRGFFGQLLSNLNVYGSSDPNYPTMCTNGLNIQYHPDFVLSQSDAAIRFVLCHEILHCVGEHMSRRGNRDPELWNYAADYAINPILNEEKDSNFNWPQNPDGTRMGLYNKDYAGMRAEDIYDILTTDAQKKKTAMGEGEKGNFGEVVDSDKDLGEADSESSIAQESDSEFGEDGQPKPTSGGQPKSTPDSEGGQGDDEKGDSESSIIGKKVRVTEGPNKGKIGTIQKVLPNGDVIIG